MSRHKTDRQNGHLLLALHPKVKGQGQAALGGLYRHALKSPDPLSDSVLRPDHLLRETTGADQRNRVVFDYIGPLHWFVVAADRIVGLSPNVDQVGAPEGTSLRTTWFGQQVAELKEKEKVNIEGFVSKMPL